eukprot:TRINITY_DN83459_c0_g1_i1.p1 TRINITY_DN83459_c0_g1~~TRINITY_DN83459_c0_g1_i1.p1  ORF type:complete len:320 (-),score=70.66 TRINITY_DN83459_c0_g1_i1:514-1329(-)
MAVVLLITTIAVCSSLSCAFARYAPLMTGQTCSHCSSHLAAHRTANRDHWVHFRVTGQSAKGRGGDREDATASVAGGVGGAVLGGLLLGPFGAVFGASLGSSWGRKKSQDEAEIEKMGLDKDMVLLAQTVASQLASVSEDRQRVVQIREDLLGRVATLEAEVQKKYDLASRALEQEDETLARTLLEEKLQIQGRLDSAKKELLKAQQRASTVQENEARLEQKALEVASLLKRAQLASGSQRLDLAAEASRLSVEGPRDPLLDKFDALERGN